MKFKHYSIIVVLFCLTTYAQEGTSSPYSFYGLGQIKPQSSIENRMMGNMNAMIDSVHINLANPASYANLRLTTFSIGATQNFNKISNAETEVDAKRTTVDYIAVALPLKKIGIGFGIMPFSSVGYKIFNNDQSNTFNFFEGTGGINKTFLGLAYKLNKNWSFGVEGQYYFGEISTKNMTFLQGVTNGTREINDSRVNGLGFNFGVNYFKKLNKDYFINSSATFAPQGYFDLKNTRQVDVVRINADQEIPVSDPVVLPKVNNTINLPSYFQIGSAFGKHTKWLIGADFVYSQNSALSNRFDDISNITFKNASKVSFGGEYTPNYNSVLNYWNRVTYRAGLRFEDTGMMLNNTTINDYGITFGLSLPLGYSLNALNLGLEYGSRGTTNNGLVKEDYFNVIIGISFSDKWFIKRKYD